MKLELNVYKNNHEVEKTYTTDTYDIMYGVLEDLVAAFDPEIIEGKRSVKDLEDLQWSGIVIKLLPQIKPLLRDIFEGLTDEEIRRTKVKELIPVFVNAFSYAFSEIKGLGNDDEGN